MFTHGTGKTLGMYIHAMPCSTLTFFPLTIGDNVVIGEGSVVEAAAIGTGVYIGKNCVISKQCILKDCCWIKDNTVLAADTIVPPFSIFEGCPGAYIRMRTSRLDMAERKCTHVNTGKFVGELPESTPEIMLSLAKVESMK